jgi:hypothetical protein
MTQQELIVPHCVARPTGFLPFEGDSSLVGNSEAVTSQRSPLIEAECHARDATESGRACVFGVEPLGHRRNDACFLVVEGTMSTQFFGSMTAESNDHRPPTFTAHCRAYLLANCVER